MGEEKQFTYSDFVDEEITTDFFNVGMSFEERIDKENLLLEKYNELVKGYKGMISLIKLIEDSNMAKTKFLINMSQEIRTPMNGIIGITELLYHTNLNDEQKGYLNMLKTSSDILLDIIGNVLDMSIIESCKLQIKNEEFDIKEDVNNIINQLVIVGHKKNIKIMYYIEPFIETRVKGDKLKLNQVLINLINNSIKYTQNGQIFLSVKKVKDFEDKIRYQFSVEDTGIGIDQSNKDKIFGAFNAEEFSYAQNHTGTGLGLAISKKLVDMMNGEIWYESRINIGSTFYFTAEFSKNSLISNNKIEGATVTTMNEKTNKKSIILVVEDNEINKKLAAAFLSKRGYDNLTASNGVEAIEVYKDLEVDLILMDIQMPELNGFEATKIIRDMETISGRHIPIIAMTAYAMIGDREKCLDVGMDDYISKPISAEILYEKIEKYIGQLK